MTAEVKPLKLPDWCGLPPGSAYQLNVYKDDRKVETVNITTKCFAFGKVKSIVDYVLEHPSISRRHAALMIHKDTGKVYMLDLKSSHGTRINGAKVVPDRPTSVGSGVIKFGASTRAYTVSRIEGATVTTEKGSSRPSATNANKLEDHVETTFVPKKVVEVSDAHKELFKKMTPKAKMLFLRKRHEEQIQEAKRARARAEGVAVPPKSEEQKDLYGGALKLKNDSNDLDGEEDLDGENDDGGPAKKAKTVTGPIGPAGPPNGSIGPSGPPSS